MSRSIKPSSGRLRSSILGSIRVPSETKNSATNASRSGTSWVCASWRSCKPLIESPARKAPSATENPTACASAAVPRQTAIATNRKSSELQVNLTRRRRRGITLIARKTSGIRSSNAL